MRAPHGTIMQMAMKQPVVKSCPCGGMPHALLCPANPLTDIDLGGLLACTRISLGPPDATKLKLKTCQPPPACTTVPDFKVASLGGSSLHRRRRKKQGGENRHNPMR